MGTLGRESGQVRLRVRSIYASELSPDGKLISATTRGRVQVWETVTGREVWAMQADKQPAPTLPAQFSPDSRSLAGGFLARSAPPNSLGFDLLVRDVATGQVRWRYRQHFPGNGAVLATVGDVIFWGDLDRRFRAFDADSIFASRSNGMRRMTSLVPGFQGLFSQNAK